MTTCGPGKHYRKSYTKASGTRVEAACVGNPSRISRSIPQDEGDCFEGSTFKPSYTDTKGIFHKNSCVVTTERDSHGCPEGTHYRGGYTRSNGTYVKPTCAKYPHGVEAAPREIEYTEHGQVQIPLKAGELTQFGYHVKLSDSERAAILQKAVQENGYMPTYRHLIGRATQNKHRPQIHDIMMADAAYVKAYGELAQHGYYLLNDESVRDAALNEMEDKLGKEETVKLLDELLTYYPSSKKLERDISTF